MTVRFSKHLRGRDGGRNCGQKGRIVEFPPLLLPVICKLAWKVVEIFKGCINLKVKSLRFKNKITHLALSFNF